MADSPEMVRVIGLSISSCMPPTRGGLVIVGEGIISDKRGGGSLRDSGFHMPAPVPQGNVLPPAWFQLKDPAMFGLVVVAQGAWSVDGLVGLDGAEAR